MSEQDPNAEEKGKIIENALSTPEGKTALSQSMTDWIRATLQAQHILARNGHFPPIQPLPKECESVCRPEFIDKSNRDYLLDKTMYDMAVAELRNEILKAKGIKP